MEFSESCAYGPNEEPGGVEITVFIVSKMYTSGENQKHPLMHTTPRARVQCIYTGCVHLFLY